MELVMLGTGAAAAMQYYNTCFTLTEDDQSFLVDTGGGNGILKVLKEEDIPLTQIHDVFISHGHNDHMLGIIWVITMIGQLMNKKAYEGELCIYCHQELADLIFSLCNLTLYTSITNHLGNRIRFVIIEDATEFEIINKKVRFFDIRSTKLKQFGFVMTMEDGKRLGFCGDEPLEEAVSHCVEKCDWLIHEAFCLYEEREKFHPYRRHHSTVKDACETAERIQIKNLILCHTEETHLQERKKLYYKEGKPYFKGNLYIPGDRERFLL
ncbi:MAG: MBL fold metallo-hydrolase [Schaedlerella sp.]|nr:MBL fold metallo-hydrolase [Schaedlerella sp.]